MKYSQRTLNMADAMARGAFGISVTEVQEKIKNIIIRSYTKLGMSIDEIAEFVGEEPKKIYTILLKEKLIVE